MVGSHGLGHPAHALGYSVDVPSTQTVWWCFSSWSAVSIHVGLNVHDEQHHNQTFISIFHHICSAISVLLLSRFTLLRGNAIVGDQVPSSAVQLWPQVKLRKWQVQTPSRECDQDKNCQHAPHLAPTNDLQPILGCDKMKGRGTPSRSARVTPGSHLPPLHDFGSEFLPLFALSSAFDCQRVDLTRAPSFSGQPTRRAFLPRERVPST